MSNKIRARLITIIISVFMITSCGSASQKAEDEAVSQDSISSEDASDRTSSEEDADNVSSEDDADSSSSESDIYYNKEKDSDDNEDALVITCFKAGAADAFVLESDNYVVMIDTGLDKNKDKIVEFLDEQG
ncbi:MAG: hypothetical protein K6G87_16925, partial [Butyrivibrio sp.]|uniref:hypothetical protein n=1 Tax=Butyrivibrio sp. TaxID=28121 RepID=UPI0025F5F7D3